MAISLKQLYLLPEYWTTTDFTHPETGEKDTAQHWEPQSGYKLYRSPDIDVTKRAASDAKTREKSTQMFYDFYAMELLHALIGSTKGMTAGTKMKATLPLAAKTGVNPALIGIDWDNVEFPLGNAVLPEKLRSQVDTMYEEVTISLSNKLQEHLRRSLVQELRHLINHSSQWQRFRNEIVSHYNKNNTLTKEDFAKLVAKYLPDMTKHLDAVKRLLVFSRHYSSMGGSDPGTIITKDDPKPEKDDPSKYYDIEKDPSAVDISKKKEDEPEEEPEDEIPDYPGWEPEAGTTDFDPEDPFSKKIKKQWKDKLKEDYASGKISPSTIRKINVAINKAGLKWEDIVLAYNNIDWNGGYGGEKWGEGVVSYLKLVQASKNQEIDKMAAIIDHIYDLSHNNGPLLNKGGMYVAAEDLDRRSKVTHIARFLPNVSPVVRTLVLNVMRYLPGTNIEVEKNIDTFLNSPTVPFSEEQKKILGQHNLTPYMGDVFVGKAPFTNKQGNYVDRKFLVKAHTNGKFTIGDSMKADSKVFDTFEQLDQYLKDVISKEIEPSYGGSSVSSPPPAATLAGEIDNYIKSHTRVKLPSDKAQLLFDHCKMGWREKGQYYKAYFNGSKRAMFYAFSDGSYLAITNEYNSFNPTTNWNAILEFTKALTENALPYPEPEKAKAHIAAGTSMAPITTLGTPPSPPSPQLTPQPTSPPAAPQTSVTPTAYPSVANQLPPNSTSSAAYSVHSGITSAPTKTIRLTKPDEDAIVNIGFSPKLINGLVWYIHKGTGDTVKFYPNNTAKLLFTSTGGGKTTIPVITFAIPKMLQWLQQKYTSDTKTSPISAPTPKPSAPATPSTPATAPAATGINPGALFNPQIQAAGFKWDQSTGTYVDGSNSLLIKPNRSSLLIFGSGQGKQFKNLPELIAYLSDEYPTQKKTSSIETQDSLSEFQFEQIKKSIEQFHNWKAEKYTDTVLVKQLDPNSKTYITKYGISKNGNEFRLFNASLGTVIDSSDLFGVVVSTLVNQINKQNPPNPLPLNDPNLLNFPEVSESDNTFTTEELEYIDAIVKSYGKGLMVFTDKNDIVISYGEPYESPKYRLTKSGGYYRILSHKEQYNSPGFYSYTQKLKELLNSGNNGGEPPSSNPNDPSPSGGVGVQNPNYQALANELIAEVAHAINMTPETVANTKSFANSNNTIPVIKAIRTFYKDNNLEYGLASAKLASENWQDFLEYIRDNGLPLMPASGSFEFNKKVVGYKSKKKSQSTGQNSSLLTNDEKDWITTFFSNNYPHLEVDLAPDGMVYINQQDPNAINEITKGYKPLFIIYKGSPGTYVFRKVSGGEKIFSSFSELTYFISTNAPALVPPSTKTPKQKGWEWALKHNYKGVNMEGLSTGANLIHNGFGWSEQNEAYVNNKIYQFVVIKPEIGFNSFYVYWVDKEGELNSIKTNDVSDVYSSIGPRGSIAKGEKENEIEAGTKEFNPSKAHLPNPSQEDLLTKIGFVKNTTQTLPDDPISYTKPSDDSGNAYFTVEIDPYTGKAEYTEVDEEGTSEGMTYPSLGHLLTFLKNKFADELNDEDDENIVYISEELESIGFIFQRTDGDIYEFYSENNSEYVGYNKTSGKLIYGISSGSGIFDIVKSFYDIDDFIAFYDSKNKNDISKRLKIIENLGFNLISNSDKVAVWKKPPQNGFEHFFSYFKSSGKVSYDVVNVDDEHTVLSKSFENVDLAISYMKYKFEFSPPEEAPYSGTDYKISFSGLSPFQSMRLNTFDEDTLNIIGFEYYPQLFLGNTKIGDPVYVQGYRTVDGRRVIFYGDGGAIYQATDSDPGMKFETVKAALQYLWQSIDWNAVSELTKNTVKWKLSAKPEPATKSGEMPYSGYDYSLISSLFNQDSTQSIFLTELDDETLNQIGFKRKQVSETNISFQKFYTNGKERIYFFANGRASYWKGPSQDDGPHYFDTVKDAMKFLWNKHTTYIEEVSNYKSFMKNWLE